MTILNASLFSLKKQEDMHDLVNEKGKHILLKAVVKKAVNVSSLPPEFPSLDISKKSFRQHSVRKKFKVLYALHNTFFKHNAFH